MTASARKFSASEAKVFRPGPFGIPLHGTCAICGERFEQPSNGRPRILCPKRECDLERQRQKRRNRGCVPERPAWTLQDKDEAVTVWAGRCGWCGHGLSLHPDVEWRSGILPVHPIPACMLEPLGARAQRWLDNVKPGCPLPNPWRSP